jgi:hypothetical protein
MKSLVQAFAFGIIGVGSLLLTACEVGPRVDGKQIKTEMDDRKIRRISKAQFTETVLKLSDSIILTLDSVGKLAGNPQAVTYIKESVFPQSTNIMQYDITLFPKAQMSNTANGNENKNKQSIFLDAGIYAFENKQLKAGLVQQSDTSWVYITNWVKDSETKAPDTVGIIMLNFPLKPLIRKMNIKGVK